MNNIIRFTGLSAVVATLFACSGDDVTKVYETTNPTVGLDLVDKGDKMPDCNKDNEGKLIYVADSGMAYFCSNKEWLSFGGENMKGADGEPGEKGDDGEKGDKGDKGAKGAKGDSGTSCSAKKVEDGIEVSCGGKVVGTLSNGEAGESCTAKEVQDGIEVSCGGKVVGTLSNGETGESCTAQVIEGVGVEVSCGGVPVDTLENGANGDCSIESDEAGVVTFSCSNGTFTVNKPSVPVLLTILPKASALRAKLSLSRALAAVMKSTRPSSSAILVMARLMTMSPLTWVEKPRSGWRRT